MTEQMTYKTETDVFLTSREAALMLGVSLRTVQLWVESGILRAWKTAGGHRRIARNSVDELLVKQREAIASQDKSLSVVIVEDEEVQRDLYQLKFEAWDIPIRLILAEDGFEGLLEIGRHKPDVIISDMCMPGMDGFQMIRAIKDNDEMHHSKIIAITSLSEADIEENGGLPPNVLVLHKSASFKVLEKLIHDIYKLKFGEPADKQETEVN